MTTKCNYGYTQLLKEAICILYLKYFCELIYTTMMNRVAHNWISHLTTQQYNILSIKQSCGSQSNHRMPSAFPPGH